MADSLQHGIKEGFLAGPCLPEEVVKVLGPDYTINPLGVKFKPNGKLRMIIDASAPYDDDQSVPTWLWSPDLPGIVSKCRAH